MSIANTTLYIIPRSMLNLKLSPYFGESIVPVIKTALGLKLKENDLILRNISFNPIRERTEFIAEPNLKS